MVSKPPDANFSIAPRTLDTYNQSTEIYQKSLYPRDLKIRLTITSTKIRASEQLMRNWIFMFSFQMKGHRSCKWLPPKMNPDSCGLSLSNEHSQNAKNENPLNKPTVVSTLRKARNYIGGGFVRRLISIFIHFHILVKSLIEREAFGTMYMPKIETERDLRL